MQKFYRTHKASEEITKLQKKSPRSHKYYKISQILEITKILKKTKFAMRRCAGGRKFFAVGKPVRT